jgi:hypothetical protein
MESQEMKEIEKRIETKFKENQDRIFKKALAFYKKKILTRKRNKNKSFDEIMRTLAFKPVQKYGSFSLNYYQIFEIEINKIIEKIVFDCLIDNNTELDWYFKTIKPYTDSIIQKIKKEYQ